MAQNITGAEELLKMLDSGRMAPAKVLTKATKTGAEIVRNDAKMNSPVKKGELRRSIRLKSEKSKKVGKKVYRVLFIGDNLAKISSTGKRSFYPASQEYGWKTQNGKKVRPKDFMKNAIKQNRSIIEETIMVSLAGSLKELGW